MRLRRKRQQRVVIEVLHPTAHWSAVVSSGTWTFQTGRHVVDADPELVRAIADAAAADVGVRIVHDAPELMS